MFFSTVVSSSSANYSSSPPTLVQLFTSSKIDFAECSISRDTGHDILNYQAVELPDGKVPVKALDRPREKPKGSKDIKPNLGIWSCRLDQNQRKGLVNTLLKTQGGATSSTAFLITIDSSDPSTVEPAVYAMQQVLLTHIKESKIDESKEESKEEKSGSSSMMTSLRALRCTKFGLAANDNTGDNETTPVEGEEDICFHLVLAACVPSSQVSMSFQEKQAHSLITYHLCRFAAALNCTLLFVQPPSKAPATSEETSLQKTLSVEETTFYIRKITVEESIESSISKGEEKDDEAKDDHAALGALHLPGQHDVELIESALLRNAHCQGKWDASKDSLWVALSPRDESKDAGNDENPQEALGDNVWLTKLKDSVSMVESKTPTKATPTAAGGKDENKDAAVSSFFENLLKK